VKDTSEIAVIPHAVALAYDRPGTEFACRSFLQESL
jgi:hypothetical protein